jgi:hypothetical protein
MWTGKCELCGCKLARVPIVVTDVAKYVKCVMSVAKSVTRMAVSVTNVDETVNIKECRVTIMTKSVTLVINVSI